MFIERIDYEFVTVAKKIVILLCTHLLQCAELSIGKRRRNIHYIMDKYVNRGGDRILSGVGR